MSGCISPFAKTDKLWFNADREAETVHYEIVKAKNEFFDKEAEEGDFRIKIDTSSSDKYYKHVKDINDNIKTFTVELENPTEEEIEEIPMEDTEVEYL